MSRFLAVALCAAGAFTAAASAQVPSPSVEPLRVSAGTALAFHLQTRLRPADGDPLDVLPPGTVLRIKILDSLDSAVDRDGTEFHGSLVSDLPIGDGVVIPGDSEVRGLLVLLRSRNHPDGFRYELLLTEITDRGKLYPVTASLHHSFFDSGAQPASVAKPGPKESPKPLASGHAKSPANPSR